MQIDLTCPVESRGVTVKTNSKTGEPYALFKLFNLSGSVIQSVSMVIHAYNENGGELGQLPVTLEELEAAPKAFFAENKAVSLEDFPEAKHLVVEFLEITFAEGEAYVKGNNVTDVKIVEPDYDEQMRLLTAAGDDACCYAKDEGTYWVCVCGRPNLTQMDTCIRCGRDKATVMDKFSSHDAISKTLEELEQAEKLAEAERLLEEARLKAERNKKIKKGALLTLCGIIALVVLYILIMLAYSGVSLLLGNSAAKKNDYLSAYKHYAAANSSAKLATVSEEVRGNSVSNLQMSGILTADEENLYFIDSACMIYKENKATGERTRLGDATGVYLNISGEWLYYLDAATGQAIRRVNTNDGSTIETVFEDTESGLIAFSLVGNELYFSLQEPRKDLTPELQEQIAQTGNSALMYQNRLYRMKIGDKKPQKVSDLDIGQFSYYQGKIYYIDQKDAQSLYVVERNGKDSKKLVSGPIYTYGFSGDSVYYTDGTPNAETNQPKLSLEKASLADGTHQETVISDSMVIGFGFEGEELYYVSFNETNIVLNKKTATETTVAIEGCQLFNVADGYFVYADIAGQFMKSTPDKSGFESVVPVTEEITVEPEAPVEEAPAEGGEVPVEEAPVEEAAPAEEAPAEVAAE